MRLNVRLGLKMPDDNLHWKDMTNDEKELVRDARSAISESRRQISRADNILRLEIKRLDEILGSKGARPSA